jgi:hypothetical protein
LPNSNALAYRAICKLLPKMLYELGLLLDFMALKKAEILEEI